MGMGLTTTGFRGATNAPPTTQGLSSSFLPKEKKKRIHEEWKIKEHMGLKGSQIVSYRKWGVSDDMLRKMDKAVKETTIEELRNKLME